MRFTVLMVLFVVVVNIAFHRPDAGIADVRGGARRRPDAGTLPMIITVTLARSAMQMAKRKVIVKRLSAIHDLGAINVLCTDKTGTLTEAWIKLMRHRRPRCRKPARLRLCLCQQPVRERDEKPAGRRDPGRRTIDMPPSRKIDEVPFDFERRRVSVLVEHGGARRLIVKGAPEDLLRLSGHSRTPTATRNRWTRRRGGFQASSTASARKGFRALGVASRPADRQPETAALSDEVDMVFAGFAVFLDPPKASAVPRSGRWRKPGSRSRC